MGEGSEEGAGVGLAAEAAVGSAVAPGRPDGAAGVNGGVPVWSGLDAGFPAEVIKLANSKVAANIPPTMTSASSQILNCASGSGGRDGCGEPPGLVDSFAVSPAG